MTMSKLDSSQVIKTVFDPSSNSLNVNVVDGTGGLTVVSSTQTAAASINGSGGAIVELIASTAINISKLIPNEQTGVPMNIYTGGSGSETVLLILSPGQDNAVEMQIPAGSRVSVRANQVTAPSSGSLFLTFVG